MLERRRSRSGLRAVALSFASVLTTPAAWVVGRTLARRSAPRALGHAHAASQQTPSSTSSTLRAHRAHEDAQRSGRPIVLLPDVASATGLEELADLFDALRTERPTAAYDLPIGHAGIGQAGTLGREDYVDAIEGVLAEAHARYEQPVDVVAVGLTCELVAVAASRVPEHVHSVVLVTPEGFVEPVLPGFVERTVRLAARRALRTPGLGAVLHHAWSGHVRSAASHDSSHDFGGLRSDDGRARAIARATCRAERRGNVEDLYDTLVVPTMFLTGGGALEADLRLRTLARRSQLFRAQSIEGTRDRPHVGDPKACADAMLAFHRSLTVRPKLRLLRGGRTGAPAAPRAHLHVATVHHG